MKKVFIYLLFIAVIFGMTGCGYNTIQENEEAVKAAWGDVCLLYTSPSPRDRTRSRMPSSA